MGRTIKTGVFSLALLGVLANPSRPESNGPAEAQRVARLIDQLGSKKFQEREQAAEELDATGGAALTALQKAGHHPDPEVSRRAEYLAQRIEKRLETAQILEPKRVHLRYHDTPLDEAVADFARKTGFALEPAAGAHNHRITLDTGETTFWPALDQFCQKAGLVEHPSNRSPGMPTQEMRVMNGRNGIIVNNIIISSSGRQAGYGFNADGPLRLISGKVQTCPTFYAGAVRLRASSAGDFPPSAGLRPGEGALWLEVTPQPKMGWQSVLDIQVEKAVDEHGQALLPSSEVKDNSGDMVLRGGRGVMGGVVVDSETGLVSSARLLPVRFKLGDKPSKTLKEFCGVVSAQIQMPVQPLLTVDDVLKSAGKTVKGKDGRALTVTEVSRDAEGVVKMRISLEEPVPANLAFNRRLFVRANRVIARNGVVLNGGIMRESGVAGESKLALVDAQGKSFGIEVNAYAMALKNNSMVQDMQMTFQPHRGQGEPARFVFSDHRLVNIDIPFVLKDVPLSVK